MYKGSKIFDKEKSMLNSDQNMDISSNFPLVVFSLFGCF